MRPLPRVGPISPRPMIVPEPAGSRAAPAPPRQLPRLAPTAFALAREEFSKFAAAHATAETAFRLAGTPVRLRCSPPGLLPLLRGPLEHLTVAGETGATVATIDVWEDPAPGNRLLADPGLYHRVPRDATPLPDPTGTADLLLLCDERFHAVWLGWIGWLQFYDRQTGRCLVLLRDARALPAWEFAAPLRSPFAHLLSPRDAAVAHGAAVGWEGRGVILAGEGGSGKSTTALRCLLAGAEFLGDDYVIAQAGPGPGALAHSLYHFAKLREDMIPNLPAVAAHRIPEGTIPLEKPTFALHPAFADRFRASLDIRAILLPRVAGRGPARIGPGDPAAALSARSALVEGTVAQIPGFPASGRRALERFTASLPCHELQLGSEPGTIPGVIRGFLERIAPVNSR
jgi:hypothetical protein